MPSTVDTSGVAAVPSQPTPTVELTATDPGSPLGVFAFVKVLEPHLLFLMLSSLTLLWIGAHSALRRPPSAAPTESTKQEKKKEKPRENLEFSDAILFPLCLGVALAGMYYVIKVLQYADIVNSILRVYMSVMSIAGTGTLIGDALDIYTSLIFPDMWADQTGRLYHIDQNQRRQLVVEKETGKKVPTPDKTNPLPGKLSEWRFSPKVVDILWGVRGILNQEWSLRFATYGKTRVKIGVRLNDIVKVSIATALAITYHFAKGIFVSNLLAIALCYSSFSLISPTSFAIGTLVLGGLFVYDIVMVFYTPLMITVASKVDAPIKLVFKGAKSGSILGLGDIVVPGFIICLALRFDQYQYYKKQIKLEPVELKTILPDGTVSTTLTHRRVKVPYVSPRNQWGNRYWTTPPGRLSPIPQAYEPISATAFPKPYFYASLIGYTFGMVSTLLVMVVFNHAQPALLYLVPGVTGSLWLTGLIRGELKDMWEYTEDGSLDVKDVVVEVDGKGNVIQQIGEEEVEKMKEDDEKGQKDKNGADNSTEGSGGKAKKDEEWYELFTFTITAPRMRLSAT